MQTEQTTETAESRVRAVWELVHVCDGVQRHVGIAPRLKGTVLIQRGACGEWHEFPSMAEALAFTVGRIVLVAKIKEKIAFMETVGYETVPYGFAIKEGIIADEQSLLTEARRGMKERP